MIKDFLQKVKKAETQAQEIEEQAKREVEQILKQTAEITKEKLQNAITLSKKEAKELIIRSEKQALEKGQLVEKDLENQAEKEIARGKINFDRLKEKTKTKLKEKVCR